MNAILSIFVVVAGLAVLLIAVPYLADAVFRLGDFVCDLFGWPR